MVIKHAFEDMFTYISIFKSRLLKNPATLTFSNVRVEIFNEDRVYDVAPDYNVLEVISTEDKIGFNEAANTPVLMLDENSGIPIHSPGVLRIQKDPHNKVSHIIFAIRSQDGGLGGIVPLMKSEINKTIALLSILYTQDLFLQKVYEGPLYSKTSRYLGAIRPVDPVFINDKFISEIKRFGREFLLTPDNENIIFNSDLHNRFRLMSDFYRKALEASGVSDREQELLWLWTILEIFPMKGDRKYYLVNNYLSQITSKEIDFVKSVFKIRKTYEARGSLVHKGKMIEPFTGKNENEAFNRLHDIVLEIIRTMLGYPYSGKLDKYFV